jgi:hypothetical protein
MAWQVIKYNPRGDVNITLDDAPVDILNVLKQGYETGSTATGINQNTGQLEVYWFTKSNVPNTDGTWTKIS